jgi:UDP:flavonoid glycosyltransferase YjiC (YdhE family)
MRVLVASTRGAGHFLPLVPFADACVRHGHEVLVAGPESLRETAEAAGHAFAVFADPPPDELEAVWSRVPQLSPDEANAVVIGDIFGRLNTTASLPGLRETCARWRPDVVLRDPSQFGAALAAELHGIPHARVAIGLASTEELSLGIAAAPLDALRRDAGLEPDPAAERLRASPYLSCFPAALEDPDVPGPPRTWRFRDPAWDLEPRPLPRWWEPDLDGAPLVYLTFGSVAGSLPMAGAVYAAAMEAVDGLAVRALLTVGHATDLTALPPAPPNLRVERWVPQADALAAASAVVCHGGSGSTLGALAAGLPLVVVPLFADQPYNARRVEAVGAGVAVPAPTRDAIRGALEAVLADGSHGAAAQRVAAAMRAQAPVDQALDVLAAA